ncbi:MAG: Na+/H+ antiporter NhaA [Bdellovibrionales bacterium]|nr:Na+/H+ antiporter NhaA [Bdellovibrionales bacterium]
MKKEEVEALQPLREKIRPEPIDRLARPFKTFLEREASAGILLLAATAIALVWANSGFAESYEKFWHAPLAIRLGSHELEFSLQHWINDFLMAVFFFVVGLEIKREILAGELSSIRKATLPVAAAIGGMIIPAAIYFGMNLSGGGSRGWGIPMATDIAFALGVLALFGSRVPLALKVFLTALAIVDDIGAVLVIAFFYTSELNTMQLFIGALFFVGLIGCNVAGIRSALVYGAISILGLWLAFYYSGIHPSIAGVVAALAIPARRRLRPKDFLLISRPLIDRYEDAFDDDRIVRYQDFMTSRQLSSIRAVEAAFEFVQTPLERLERGLHPWVIFGIMPIFALANAGVHLNIESSEMFLSSVTWGVALGLLIGKQVGIFAFSYIACRLGWAVLPYRTTFLQLYGVSCLGGIGFTMSLFIAGLAFPAGTAHYDFLANAKVGILIGSILSGLLGAAAILVAPKADEEGTAEAPPSLAA